MTEYENLREPKSFEDMEHKSEIKEQKSIERAEALEDQRHSEQIQSENEQESKYKVLFFDPNDLHWLAEILLTEFNKEYQAHEKHLLVEIAERANRIGLTHLAEKFFDRILSEFGPDEQQS